MSRWALWTGPICEECLGGPYGPGPFVRNVSVGPMDRAHLSGSTIKKQPNQDITEAAGEGMTGIRNIEIAIRNIGLNSKETAKLRHNGGGGGEQAGGRKAGGKNPGNGGRKISSGKWGYLYLKNAFWASGCPCSFLRPETRPQTSHPENRAQQ